MVRHVDTLPTGYRYAGTDTNRLGVVYVGPDYLPALPDPEHTPVSADGFHCDACGRAVHVSLDASGSGIRHV